MAEIVYTGIKVNASKPTRGNFEDDIITLRQLNQVIGHYDRPGQLVSFLDEKGHVGTAHVYEKLENEVTSTQPSYVMIGFSNQSVSQGTIEYIERQFAALDANFSTDARRQTLLEQIKYDQTMINSHQLQITANYDYKRQDIQVNG
ncbi:hypothetical protein EQG49_00495 [Periweissella cryptocerci]|uniref:Uncharacterized protein n=2 Tax=Periweissella cryptocerci TaxID=2506420 RepID=A0A4P6YR17_9LACO|nr:hypothetical protein EQG49_00495 [Periweissella cryptocerci]